MSAIKQYYGNGSSGPSLGDQISAAETVAEVHALLAVGESYLNATPRTQNRWRRLAKKRRTQLQHQGAA